MNSFPQPLLPSSPLHLSRRLLCDLFLWANSLGNLGKDLLHLSQGKTFLLLCSTSLWLLISAQVWQEKAQSWKPQTWMII